MARITLCLSLGLLIAAPALAAQAEPAPTGRQPVELGYFTLGFPDTARASRFYAALFGWTSEQGHLGGGYVHVNNTKLPLGLTPDPATDPPVLYFRVPSLATYVARVRELGGEVIDQSEWSSGAGAACRDDQGRTFHLWEPAPGY